MAHDVPFQALPAILDALVETGRIPSDWLELAGNPERLVAQIRASGTVGQLVLVPFAERVISPYNIESIVYLNDESSINTLTLTEPKETRLALVNKAESGVALTFLRRDIAEAALDRLTEDIPVDLKEGYSEHVEAAASDWTDDGGYSTKSGSI